MSQVDRQLVPTDSKEARHWAMILHFSMLLGYVVPLAGLVVPIIVWQTKKTEFPSLEAHGRMAMNFMISIIIYTLVVFLLSFVVIGLVLMVPLGVIYIAYPIIAGIRANDGVLWHYPGIIKFLK